MLKAAMFLSLTVLIATLLGFIGIAGSLLAVAKYFAFLFVVLLVLIFGSAQMKNVV